MLGRWGKKTCPLSFCELMSIGKKNKDFGVPKPEYKYMTLPVSNGPS
jgi:hypothetical protein